MSFHSWNMAEGLYRCAQVCTGVHRWVQVCTGVYRWVQVCRGVSVTGWRRCVLPVDEHVLLHVAGRVSQTLTGQGLVLVPVIPQHNTQTEKQWGEPAVNSHHQNRTEQNSPTTMWPGFYMWFLSEWFLNLHCITDGNALLFRSEAAVVVFQLCTVVYIMMLLNSN